MIYVILAAIFIGIGVLDIAPFVDWIDEKNLSMAAKSAIMLSILGGVPALIIGVSIIGDTFWNKRNR